MTPGSNPLLNNVILYVLAVRGPNCLIPAVYFYFSADKYSWCRLKLFLSKTESLRSLNESPFLNFITSSTY